MEFLGNPSALFQAHVFFSNPLFLLLPRLNFRRGRVPSFHAARLDQRAITKQEPPVGAIFSEQSCLEFKRAILQQCTLADRSHSRRIVWMTYPTDPGHGPRPCKPK